VAGRHSTQTNQRSTCIIPPILTPDALPATTLPLYPGFGQAPNMLACIPSGYTLTETIMRKTHTSYAVLQMLIEAVKQTIVLLQISKVR